MHMKFHCLYAGTAGIWGEEYCQLNALQSVFVLQLITGYRRVLNEDVFSHIQFKLIINLIFTVYL